MFLICVSVCSARQYAAGVEDVCQLNIQSVSQTINAHTHTRRIRDRRRQVYLALVRVCVLPPPGVAPQPAGAPPPQTTRYYIIDSLVRHFRPIDSDGATIRFCVRGFVRSSGAAAVALEIVNRHAAHLDAAAALCKRTTTGTSCLSLRLEYVDVISAVWLLFVVALLDDSTPIRSLQVFLVRDPPSFSTHHHVSRSSRTCCGSARPSDAPAPSSPTCSPARISRFGYYLMSCLVVLSSNRNNDRNVTDAHAAAQGTRALGQDRAVRSVRRLLEAPRRRRVRRTC